MATAINRVFPVFRTGTHTDSAGESRTFTAEQLREIADRYDPDAAPAPLVKGHPATDDPAFGWVDRFMFEETTGTLYAVPRDVDPDFAAEVKARRFARISIALHSPGAPANPFPGMFYPKHIGFLGAATPAVSGLKAANFHDSGEVLMFDFNDDSQVRKFSEVMATTFANVLEKLGFKPTPAIPDADPDPSGPDASEFAELGKKAEQLEADLEAERAKRAELEGKARREECSAFAERLVSEGKLTPVEGEQIAEILFSMSGLADDLTFSVDDGDDVVGTPATLLKAILSNLPKRIEFDELSGQGSDGLSGIHFRAPADREVSASGLDLHRRATAYAAEHGVEYIDAVSIVENTGA